MTLNTTDDERWWCEKVTPWMREQMMIDTRKALLEFWGLNVSDEWVSMLTPWPDKDENGCICLSAHFTADASTTHTRRISGRIRCKSVMANEYRWDVSFRFSLTDIRKNSLTLELRGHWEHLYGAFQFAAEGSRSMIRDAVLLATPLPVKEKG